MSTETDTVGGFPRLSGEFNRGYTKAIQDVIEVFNYVLPDLKDHHKNLNGKLSLELLHCFLENREKLRDSTLFEHPREQGFIRYNGQLGKFEYYKPNREDMERRRASMAKYQKNETEGKI